MDDPRRPRVGHNELHPTAQGGFGELRNVSTTIGAGDTSYSDTGLTPGTLYTYQIRAVNGVGNAPWSNEPSATTDNDVPAAITGMTATKSGARQVNLAWTTPNAHGAALTGYRLERKAGTGNYALVTSAIGVTATTYSDTGLTPGDEVHLPPAGHQLSGRRGLVQRALRDDGHRRARRHNGPDGNPPGLGPPPLRVA